MGHWVVRRPHCQQSILKEGHGHQEWGLHCSQVNLPRSSAYARATETHQCFWHDQQKEDAKHHRAWRTEEVLGSKVSFSCWKKVIYIARRLSRVSRIFFCCCQEIKWKKEKQTWCGPNWNFFRHKRLFKRPITKVCCESGCKIKKLAALVKETEYFRWAQNIWETVGNLCHWSLAT